MADQPGYVPLTEPEKRKLQDDQELRRNPKFRADFAATLNDADRQWLDLALKPQSDKPLDLMGKMREGTNAAVGYTREHPAEVGATALTLPVMWEASALPLLLRASLAGTAAAAGAGGGLELSKLFDPESPVKNATYTDMAAQAADQGANAAIAETGGGTLNWLLNTGARQGMSNAIGSQSAIRRNFPSTDLEETLLRNRINPTLKEDAPLFGMRSYKGSGKLRGQSAVRAQGLADEAGARGVGVTRADVAPWMKGSEKMAVEDLQAGFGGGQQQIDDSLDQLFDAQFPYGDVPAQNTPNVIRSLQRKGRTAQAATTAGNLPSALPAATAQDMASGIRQTMNQKVPGFQAANQETQDLIAATKVARNVSQRPPQMPSLRGAATGGVLTGAGVAAGDPILGAGLGLGAAAMTMPQVSAPVAIAMYQAGRIPYDMLLQLVGPAVARQVGFAPIHGVKMWDDQP